jgi:AcrR family transcriptional regulator
MHIIEKSLELFQKYGIKSVTMDDLSMELGMSKKTLYQYFNDKNDLVKKVITYEFEKKLSVFNSIMNGPGNAIDHLVAANNFILGEQKSHRPSLIFDLQKYFTETHNEIHIAKRNHLFNAIKSNLIKGIDEGIYRADLDAEIIAKLHVFRVESILTNDIFTMEELTSLKFANEIFNYHLRGIVNEKGLKILKENLK